MAAFHPSATVIGTGVVGPQRHPASERYEQHLGAALHKMRFGNVLFFLGRVVGERSIPLPGFVQH